VACEKAGCAAVTIMGIMTGGPEMAAENDKVVEKLEIWKKRVFIAFLLIASVFGATALLILEFGVVEKAWNLEWSGHGATVVEAGSALQPPRFPPPFLLVGAGCDGNDKIDAEAMAEVSPQARFDAAMHELYGRIVRESGYTPAIFFRMIEQYGGLEAAHRLLKPDADFFSYDFQHLCRMRRDDLTMESLILSLDYKDRLFSASELAIAAERLAAAQQLFRLGDR
jgi:hypothetical protein